MSDPGPAPVSIARRAAAGAGWIIAWRMVSRNLGLISTLILVRLLQPSDFGLVTLATGLINSVDSLSAIGVFDALVRAPVADRDMYDTGFTLNAIRNVTTSTLIVLFAWPTANYLGDPRLAVVMIALAIGLAVASFENIAIVDFRRHLDFQKEFILSLSARVTGVVTTVGVAIVWHSYWALVIGLFALRVVRIPLSYMMLAYRPRVSLRAWRSIIGFSLWSWAQTMLGQVRERSESIVIGRVLGTRLVGEFFVGAEIGTLPTTELIEPVGRALFSGFASLHNASQGSANLFLSAVGLGYLLVLPAGMGISMIADPMVRLMLGDQWLAAVPVVQIMAVGAVMAVFAQPCAAMLNAIGRPHVAFYLTGVSTAVKVVALVLLVPSNGLSGAAYAIVISGLVDAALYMAAAMPRMGVSMWQLGKCLIRPTIATAAMMLLLWWLGMAWVPSTGRNFWEVGQDTIIRSGTGAVCYAATLLTLWLAAARPDGAEQFILTMIQQTCRRAIPLIRRNRAGRPS